MKIQECLVIYKEKVITIFWQRWTLDNYSNVMLQFLKNLYLKIDESNWLVWSSCINKYKETNFNMLWKVLLERDLKFITIYGNNESINNRKYFTILYDLIVKWMKYNLFSFLRYFEYSLRFLTQFYKWEFHQYELVWLETINLFLNNRRAGYSHLKSFLRNKFIHLNSHEANLYVRVLFFTNFYLLACFLLSWCVDEIWRYLEFNSLFWSANGFVQYAS